MITEDMVKEHLKERYDETGKNVIFLTRKVAKSMGVSTHSVTHAVLKLEAEGTVERFNASNLVRWRTCFGKK